MSNPAYIQFIEDENFKSCVFYSHWGGEEVIERAKNFVKDLKLRIANGEIPEGMPLGRLDPGIVMFNFIRKEEITFSKYEKDELVHSSYYLYGDSHEDMAEKIQLK